ncbi:MAG: pilus assembly protein [Planctomycetes bacterium]|nr:pilus assembly protein [Planctomycetota bacterium]
MPRTPSHRARTATAHAYTEQARSPRRLASRKRQGAATIELALVLPIYLLFVFVLFQIGHALMISNMMNAACRNAARLGATEGVTSQQVRDRVLQTLTSTLDTDQVTLMVKNAAAYDRGASLPETEEQYEALPDLELTDAEKRQLFLVRASVEYNDVALLSLPFMDGVQLTGVIYIRHE